MIGKLVKTVLYIECEPHCVSHTCGLALDKDLQMPRINVVCRRVTVNDMLKPFKRCDLHCLPTIWGLLMKSVSLSKGKQ